MAIAQDIAAIRGAAYGKDVREAIAHGIEQCYTDVTNSSTLANTAANSANTAASNANQNSQAANQAAQAANTAAQTVDNKVAESVGNIILVQETQPTEEDNKIWVKPESDEFKVPTWDEFQAVASATSGMRTEQVTGTDVVINAIANTRYICGEVSSIVINPAAEGIFEITFTSGTSAPVMTAEGVTWPEWFDPDSLSTSVIYEISIADKRGVVCIWPTA